MQERSRNNVDTYVMGLTFNANNSRKVSTL
jgi:hypothetical protein